MSCFILFYLIDRNLRYKGAYALKKEIKIKDDYITLGQLLKVADLISSGGESKFFIQQHRIYHNGMIETRRGKKIYSGDSIFIDQKGTIVVVKSS